MFFQNKHGEPNTVLMAQKYFLNDSPCNNQKWALKHKCGKWQIVKKRYSIIVCIFVVLMFISVQSVLNRKALLVFTLHRKICKYVGPKKPKQKEH